MLEFIKKLFSLQTFGDGGGNAGGTGGAAGGDAGAATGAEAPAASEGKAAVKLDKAGQAAKDLSKVQYGRQEAEEPATDQQPEADQEAKKTEQPAKRQTFDELIKNDPEYAKEMQKRIDNAINRRFAKSKAAEEQNARLMPALNLLAGRYGVKAGDTDALIDAINGDSDLIEQQAMDAGMEPEAYRKYQALEAELNQLKEAEAERQRAEQTQQKLVEWQQQAEVAQRFYPGLDLRTEAQNETFTQLLAAGIDVKTAYETVHMAEIQQGLVQHAAADAKRQTVASIANKQGRPREAASGKTAASTVKSDISKLTTRDFDEIMRRAARGDVIRF